MWYLSFTKSDEPSNRLDEERDFGRRGLMIWGLISRVSAIGGEAKELEAREKRVRREKTRRGSDIVLCEWGFQKNEEWWREKEGESQDSQSVRGL